MKKIIAMFLAFVIAASCIVVPYAETSVVKVQCENMTLDGQYAGAISSPFSGVGLYGNGDEAYTNIEFPYANAYYRISVRGASSSSSSAGVSLYVDGKKRAAFSFSSESASTQSVDITMNEAKTVKVRLLLETDNGSNDTYIDYLEVTHTGTIPDPPSLPETGAVQSGNYRNLFTEMGISQADVDKKLEDMFQQYFYGTDGEDIINEGKRVYYPVGDDMAYIYDTGNGDVRSEGMSYGMMIAVQMDKKEEFDRLWKWAKTYMYHSSGERKGMFAWQCTTSGSKKDNNPASDGEEYFATALLFASARWGDGEGIYNYRQEALTLLSYMLHTNDRPGYELKTIFDPVEKMVVFTPYGSAASYTDPSYHLPAFYEIWAREAEEDKALWLEIADISRGFFKKCAHETTGLTPDYAYFTGEGYGSRKDYSYDSWRVPMNVAMDYAWWKADEWSVEYSNRIQGFFHSEGIGSYYDNYELDGTPKYNADHSIGAVACNAVASLAADTSISWEFVNELWNSPMPEGKWRYYNGMLYMLGMLNVSGNYKVYLSEHATLEIPDEGEGEGNTSGESALPSGEWVEILNHKSGLEEKSSMYTKYSTSSGISYNKYGPSSTQCMQITGGGSSSSSGIKIDISDLVDDGDYIKAEFRIQVTGAVDSIRAFVTDDTTETVLKYDGEETLSTGKWYNYPTKYGKVKSENGNVYFCVSNASGFWYIVDLVLYKFNPDPQIAYAGIEKTNDGDTINAEITLSSTFKEKQTVYRIIACYEGTTLMHIEICEEDVKAEDDTIIPISITNNDYDKITVMFWWDLLFVQPLFHGIELL